MAKNFLQRHLEQVLRHFVFLLSRQAEAFKDVSRELGSLWRKGFFHRPTMLIRETARQSVAARTAGAAIWKWWARHAASAATVVA